jgi:beta-lactamase superfamily II metal-dependent hydrolase
MPIGEIKEYRERRTAHERASFAAPLFRAPEGDEASGSLPWGTEVEILGRGADRVRVRTPEGEDGWVAAGQAVEIGYLARRRSRGEWDYTAPVYEGEADDTVLYELLWGDRIQVVRRGERRSRVRARGGTGWVSNEAIGDQSLLEVYFIDVGQGDGVLIRTPDHRHVLIDGGYPRTSQPTGKSAADFVDWKFFRDYGDHRIRLDAMMASHCDADHYGGLWDLVSGDARTRSELDCDGIDVEAFYHAGVSWWNPGRRSLGREEDGCLVDLIDDRASVVAALDRDADPRLQGWWSDFLRDLVEVAPRLQRLGTPRGGDPGWVPGFDPASAAGSLRILGPVTREVGGGVGLPVLEGGPAQNTNGHSLLLRLDYGRARILMTGDLNRRSMGMLLAAYEGRAEELACDVAKGCHHGSDDVSYAFLQALRPACTVISSGDSDGHGHPRPAIVAASATTGYLEIDTRDDRLITPLVYATEVERSTRVAVQEQLEAFNYPHGDEALTVRLYGVDPDRLPEERRPDARAKDSVFSRIHYAETSPGAIRAKRGERGFPGSRVVTGIVYGLVNVRTDGETLMCATRNEGDATWEVRSFRSRF